MAYTPQSWGPWAPQGNAAERDLQIRDAFLAVHGHRWRIVSGHWWMLDDQGFWTKTLARYTLAKIFHQISKEAGDELRPYRINRLARSLADSLTTTGLPGVGSRAVRHGGFEPQYTEPRDSEGPETA